MRAIRLYGPLRKFLGKRVFRAEVSTAAEAVRCLLANFPHLEAHMASQHYKVQVGSEAISEEELHFPSSEKEDIRIIPVIVGSGAAVKIIAGVALVALSFITFGAGLAFIKPVLFGIGLSLTAGGVAQLLTPVPKTALGPESEKDARQSYGFSGIQNVSRQGVSLPVVYGTMYVGSVVVSAGVNTDQV